jgi:hypothetical protein
MSSKRVLGVLLILICSRFRSCITNPQKWKYFTNPILLASLSARNRHSTLTDITFFTKNRTNIPSLEIQKINKSVADSDVSIH